MGLVYLVGRVRAPYTIGGGAMKTLVTLSAALILTTPLSVSAQAMAQLQGFSARPRSALPQPGIIQPEIMEDPSAPTAGFDFVVREEAEFLPGDERFDPFDGSRSAAVRGSIPFIGLAGAEAKAQGMDLALVLAVIQKESSFNPKVKSKAGAVGLMQLLPSTAKWLGLKDTSKLTDPATNIKYGVKYMKMLWDEFGQGSPALLTPAKLTEKSSQMSLAAYNAGPGNVRKYNDVPPFRETRDYVKKVTAYFGNYDKLLGDRSAQQ